MTEPAPRKIPKSHVINFRVDDTLLSEINALAAAARRPRADWIFLIVEAAVKDALK